MCIYQYIYRNILKYIHTYTHILEEGMATYSSILAWRIPWTEELGGLQSRGSQRVRHDWSDLVHTYTQTYLHIYGYTHIYTNIYMCVCVKVKVMVSCVQPFAACQALLCLWNSPGKNTGVGSHSLLQRIFLTQGSNLGLLHCRQILYSLSHQGSPRLCVCVCVYTESTLGGLWSGHRVQE